ncbi:ATP-dependent DNA helicase [Vibrio crassostreae]|uniref:ATP-dependent DNA helicase n=1 Tax=Vibrio crassostreae TaxID=246167 RepID=UPI001B31848A|nr:AAA family ATPase [Vibrio crassostreae]
MLENTNYKIIETLTEEQKLVFSAVLSGANIFLTSGGGCGKSYLIDVMARFLPNIVLLAPTGVSALNIKGATLHSFFSLPFGFHSDDEHIELSKDDIGRLTSAETILIDEVSMARCDTLDRIDRMLRLANSTNKPFGGKQIILVGDFCQLPPVVVNRSEEATFLRKAYRSSYYAFNSKAWAKADFKSFVLTEVKRQSDAESIKHLRNLRMGLKIEEAIQFINQNAGNTPLNTDIRLYPTNKMVEEYNRQRYAELGGREFVYTGVKKGKFPESSMPVPEEIALKVGCRVMFVTNDPEQGVVNGDMATVEKLTRRKVTVKLDRSEEYLEIGKYSWEAYEYDENAQKSHSGTYQQYPIKLAFAISQHKSQGQSLERSVVSFKPRTFAAGQAYVALSRITDLKGLSLEHPITRRDILFSKEAASFTIAISKDAISNRKQGLSIYPELLVEDVIQRDLDKIKEASAKCLEKVLNNDGSFTDWVTECKGRGLSVYIEGSLGEGCTPVVVFDVNGLNYRCIDVMGKTEVDLINDKFSGKTIKERKLPEESGVGLANFSGDGVFLDMATIDCEFLP